MKNTMIKKIILSGIVLNLLFPASSFGFFPVIDPTAIYNLVHQLETLNNQYKVMKQEYENAQNRLDEAKALRSDTEGHYGFGNLLDGGKYKANREWSPDDWQSTLKGLSGGNPARYKQLLSQYQNDNPTLSESDYSKGAGHYNAVVYQDQIKNNQAATVTSTYAFNNIKQHIEHIRQISKQIESAPNQKSAVDLNTRMEGEIGYVQVEMLKQMALINEQKADENTNQIRYESQAAKFNRLPDE